MISRKHLNVVTYLVRFHILQFRGHTIPGTPYLIFFFGPGFGGLSLRSNRPSTFSMKFSSPNGRPVRSCFLNVFISHSSMTLLIY